jgi:hypothetical protein
MVRPTLVLLRWAIQARAKMEGNNWFHVPVQIVVLGFCVYWYFHLPLPTKAVLILTGVTVVMALLEMHPTHKAVYLLLVICLMFIENRALNKDHADLVAGEEGRRKEENTKFDTIAKGLQTSIENGQNQFAATMDGAKALLNETRSIAELSEKSLNNLTGGKSFPYVSPQVWGSPNAPVALVVWNHGNEILTGVSVAISNTNDPNWADEFMTHYSVGTLGPHDMFALPVVLTPQLRFNGQDHYWIQISAQNGTVDEGIFFRQSKKRPGYWDVSFNVNSRVKVSKTVTKFPLLMARGWSDEGGQDLLKQLKKQ